MRWAFIDFGHPFYRPLTRRIIIFSLLVVWAGVEYLAGASGWMLLFLVLAAYVGWGFFLSGQVGHPGDDVADTPSSDEGR